MRMDYISGRPYFFFLQEGRVLLHILNVFYVSAVSTGRIWQAEPPQKTSADSPEPQNIPISNRKIYVDQIETKWQLPALFSYFSSFRWNPTSHY